MKIVTIFILMLFSCNQVKNARVETFENMNLAEPVGTWQLCKRQIGDDFILSNICQTVKFQDNSNGELLMGDELICKFNWKIEKDLIKFSFKSKDDQSKFLSGELDYNFKFYDKNEFRYFEITPKDKKIIFFLSKKK